LHALTHWGTQALCDHFLRSFGCVGVWEIARSVKKGCMIYQRVNNKVMSKMVPGDRELARRPFQNIQVDFTKLPPVQRFKYTLVIVDHLTHWVEAIPSAKATANAVSKVLLEQIIPRYGVVNSIDLDRGPHFTSKVLQHTMEALQIKWHLHTLWHLQSSGRVKRMNQTLKTVLTELMVETQMSWLKCLPLALLRIQTLPQADLGISPYEATFGLPYLITPYGSGIYEEGENVTRKYVQTIATNLEDLRKRGYLPQTTPLDFRIHQIQPGVWVLIKTGKDL
ncbi:TF28 protein, partial [Mohoua ochrocephala]|nr:TF28 protein [Mohoua ochrocephala]